MASTDPQSPSVQSSLEETRRLRRAVEELSVLNDLARAIGASLDLQDIMHTIIHRSLRAVHAEQGVITLVEQDSNEPMKTLVRTMVSSSKHPQYHANQSLLGWMHLNKKPLMINDPGTDERFRGVRWDPSIRSLLCVPMMVKSNLIAVLTIYNKRDAGRFSSEDERLLAIIGAQSAQVMDNARLYEEELALQQMKEEVRLAARIQEDLLPKQAPKIPGYDVAGRSLAAQVVGGDYFDFIPMEGGRYALCIGDVSGKGLPAALLMANVQATLRGQTLLNPPAKVCLKRANKLLYDSTSSEKFVTLFYSILDPTQHTLSFCNAGHNSPVLLIPGADPRYLDTGGLVLSILEDFPYEEDVTALNPGDILVLYSDGVTEAFNKSQELFGEDRLVATIRAHQHESAEHLIDCIIESVEHYSLGAPHADDMTLVVVKRLRQSV